MLKFIQKKLKEEKGLTLIELLAVIVILGIIAAIAIPAIGNIIENSRFNAVKSDAINVLNAAQLYYTDVNDPDGSVTVGELQSEGFLESPGEIPTAATVSDSNPLALTTASFDFGGPGNVKFTNATIQSINANETAGSDVPAGGIEITGTIPTPGG